MKAPSPASGVRAAPPPPPTIPTPQVSYVPPRPAWESESSLTRIGDPDPSLLAMARGEKSRPRAERALWFVLGVLVGALGVWIATGDPPSDVYRARLWAASALRAMHGAPAEPAEAPSAAPSPPVASVPTVDVSELPRAPAPAPASAVTPAPAAAPPSPGAPALTHAPGPR